MNAKSLFFSLLFGFVIGCGAQGEKEKITSPATPETLFESYRTGGSLLLDPTASIDEQGKITLERFSKKRATAHYIQYCKLYDRAHKRIVGGSIGIAFLLFVAFILGKKNTSGKKKESQEEEASVPGATIEQQSLYLKKKKVQAMSDANNMWVLMGKATVNGLFLTISATIASGLVPVLHHIYDSVDSARKLWSKGYMHWYSLTEHRLIETINTLLDSLHQAREAQKRSEANPVVRIDKQGTIASYYRSSIMSSYHELVSLFERTSALMYALVDEHKRPLLVHDVQSITSKIDAFARQLEFDFNENTEGILTRYSNRTMETFQILYDSISMYLDKFNLFVKNSVA